MDLDSRAIDEIVATLNAQCFCVSLDEAALRRAFDAQQAAPGLFELVRERCPHLFAARPVFVAPSQARRMADVVRAVESVVALPAYRETVLARAPAIARRSPRGARGVFFGYDFHLHDGRLGLIEINTNAGGAMLNAVLARAQAACCPQVADMLPPASRADAFEAAIVAMFADEWAVAHPARPLRRIAIVDEAPPQQYLYPEFRLFAALFARHGIDATIADPAALEYRDGALIHDGRPVDLVYNRLTDFALEQPASATLRAAYVDGAAVVTPHPQAHTLYADKRNLVLLSDPHALEALGVPPDVRALLGDTVPRTVEVDAGNADTLWSERRHWFFKPYGGFGSRAAYRGDKLTRRVWQGIVAGGYVAQALVAPGARAIAADTGDTLKYDLRQYVYDGAVQWTAARLYQGQTTNFRTPGGGFAPVYASCCDASPGPAAPSDRSLR